MTRFLRMTQKELSVLGIIKDLLKGLINGTEAAKLTYFSLRHVKRLKARLKEEGDEGIIHKSRGKESKKKISEKEAKKIARIIRSRYGDFGPTLAQEKLKEVHKIKRSKETIRQIMIQDEIWKERHRRKNHEYRMWRERKDYVGELIQFDGSYHEWFEERAPRCCLLAAIDDASGKMMWAKFCYDEGVKPVFVFWKGYVPIIGKPVNVYHDKLRTYQNNLKYLVDDPEHLTQFQRAMKELEIHLIPAHSPQAKGRIERLFGTLQDRLIKEMRLAKINTIEQANRFLEERFIPRFNAQFAVEPKESRDLHRPLTRREKERLESIFSIKKTRTVDNDFTLRYENWFYQLTRKQPILVLRRVKVLIEERTDGKLFIELRGKYLHYRKLPKRPPKVSQKEWVRGPTSPDSSESSKAPDKEKKKVFSDARKKYGSLIPSVWLR